ncbi:MAG TPA: FAD-binding oxidoreductase [Terriglobales bacterium]|nr:FAD-binding oxidoreductase [Terriglobales bacterium]
MSGVNHAVVVAASQRPRQQTAGATEAGTAVDCKPISVRPKDTVFGSLDQQTSCVGRYQDVRSPAELERLGDGPLIARGAGVSFVAASFADGAQSIGMQRLNRVVAFAPDKKQVTVEAGMTLGALYDFLLPHRFYLPIQPGHPQISIGGCVACNVHGKNPQRDGLFSEQVESLQLFHPDYGVIELSRQEDPEVFDLTCGGYGLTGIILTVTLRLAELPGPLVEMRKVPVRDLEDACEKIEELRSQCDFLYTWNDVSRFGKSLGRGYVCCGRFDAEASGRDQPLPRYRPILPPASRGWRPKVLYPQVIQSLTRIHYHRELRNPVRQAHLCNVLYPGMYGGGYYFGAYGASGFFGHMVLVPEDRWREYVRRLNAALRAHGEPLIALAIKAFRGPQRLLHFNGTGFSMHSHVPHTARGLRLLEALERLSDELGMIRTIYFDSRLSARAAQQMYPQYELFRQRLHRFDPQRRFVSALSRRLEL